MNLILMSNCHVKLNQLEHFHFKLYLNSHVHSTQCLLNVCLTELLVLIFALIVAIKVKFAVACFASHSKGLYVAKRLHPVCAL